jgi:hypothetical protein
MMRFRSKVSRASSSGGCRRGHVARQWSALGIAEPPPCSSWPHTRTGDELLSYTDVRTTAHAELLKAEACRSTLSSHRALDEIVTRPLCDTHIDGTAAAAIIDSRREASNARQKRWKSWSKSVPCADQFAAAIKRGFRYGRPDHLNHRRRHRGPKDLCRFRALPFRLSARTSNPVAALEAAAAPLATSADLGAHGSISFRMRSLSASLSARTAVSPALRANRSPKTSCRA